ncbi:MAG: nucleotide exchange factor GrpE [Terracidiphilus sp.]|jgi:molecular chaperone GrpE
MPEQETELRELEPGDPYKATQVNAEEELSNSAPADGQIVEITAETPTDSVRREEFDRLKSERDQLLDRLARLQAEFENARKRGERERTEFREYATGSVVEQFLPVLDNFELALKHDSTAEQLRAGVDLIVKQMKEVLQKLQVSPVPTVGEAFDPHVHEALGSVERDDLPDQHVAEEVRTGYKLRERLLRPALVRVVHNPKQTSE